MKVVFMGTPDFAVGTLEEIVKAGHEVAAVVTQPDKPKGRGKTLMPTPVKEAALKYAIPVYQPLKVRAEEFVKVLEKIAPDMIDKVVVPIEKEETGGSLFDKLSIAGAKLCVKVMADLEAGVAGRISQPEESTTPYAKMISKQMGKIDWNRPAK